MTGTLSRLGAMLLPASLLERIDAGLKQEVTPTVRATQMADSLYDMIAQELDRIWDNQEPVEGFESGRENILRLHHLVELYALQPGAEARSAETLREKVAECRAEWAKAAGRPCE